MAFRKKVLKLHEIPIISTKFCKNPLYSLEEIGFNGIFKVHHRLSIPYMCKFTACRSNCGMKITLYRTLHSYLNSSPKQGRGDEFGSELGEPVI